MASWNTSAYVLGLCDCFTYGIQHSIELVRDNLRTLQLTGSWELACERLLQTVLLLSLWYSSLVATYFHLCWAEDNFHHLLFLPLSGKPKSVYPLVFGWGNHIPFLVAWVCWTVYVSLTQAQVIEEEASVERGLHKIQLWAGIFLISD